MALFGGPQPLKIRDSGIPGSRESRISGFSDPGYGPKSGFLDPFSNKNRIPLRVKSNEFHYIPPLFRPFQTPGWTCPQCRGIYPDFDPKWPKMTHFRVFFKRPKCRALEENPRSQNKSLRFQRGISARARAREAPKIRGFDPFFDPFTTHFCLCR